MKLLLPLASLLGLEVEALIKRIREDALVLGIVAFFCVVGVVFALIAAHAALLPLLGPIWTPAVMAGAAFLIALIVYGATRTRHRTVERREAVKRQASDTRALVTTAALTAAPMLLKSPLVRKFGLPIGGALAVLYVLSRRNGPDDGDTA
jgi:4-amino-4-deoxy-L-arabinose transferase-like glycosyltransferase